MAKNADDDACAHCRGQRYGHATAYNGLGGRVKLCHPDEGMDCYRLVTIYRHSLPCLQCSDARLLTDAHHDR